MCIGKTNPATTLDVNGTLSTKALTANSATIAGIEMIEMNAKLLQKVEELSLYIIQIKKRLSDLESK